MRVLPGLLLITVALWAPALAHEAHAHKTMGTVATLHGSHLEVAGTDKKAHAFPLGDKTRVLRGNAVVRMSDIRVGERVVVVYTQTKDQTTGKTTIAVQEVHLPAGNRQQDPALSHARTLYW